MRLSEKKWVRIGVIFAFWNAFAVFDFLQTLYITLGNGTPFYWPKALACLLLIFNLWGIFSIFVIRLGRKFRIDGPDKLKHIILHLACSATIALVHLALVPLIWKLFSFGHATDNPFWDAYLQLASKWFDVEILMYWSILGISYAFEYYSNKGKTETPEISNYGTGNWPERIAVKSNGSTYFLKIKDIEWIEAADYYVQIHANGNSHLLRETMKEIQRKLNPKEFLRIHRSTIVNIDRIKKLDPLYNGETAVILHNGIQLKLSRRRKKTLQFIFGQPI